MDYWISPEGKKFVVYGDEFASHWAFALTQFPNSDNPVDSLENLGWLHISGGHIHKTYREVTNSQIDALYDILEKNVGHWAHDVFGRSLNRLMTA